MNIYSPFEALKCTSTLACKSLFCSRCK